MTGVLEALLDVDAALEQAGVPPLSSYWRGEAERFYSHPSALLLVECVGRGGDKSRTSTKMAIAEALAGDFCIPPGERHYFTHVAENRDEAAKTLAVLEQYLRILRVPFTRAGDTVELGQLPRGFKVLACRVGAVSGWRCIGWTADECAKWDNEGADPSAEVIASIRAMTVTHPMARGRMFSSPLGVLGHFYDTWVRGNEADQVAGHAASWEANPSITEERTRLLERDERKWQREYKAIATQECDESLFSALLVDRATRAEPIELGPEPGCTYVGSIDPGMRGNGFSFCIATRRRDGAGRSRRSIVLAREWRGTPAKPLDPFDVLSQIATLSAPYGLSHVISDQYHGDSLAAIGRRAGIGVIIETYTAPQKLARYEDIVLWLGDEEIELPPLPQLRADLLSVRRRLTASGFTIHLPQTGDGRHGDYAPAVVSVLHRARIEAREPPPATGSVEAERLAEEQRVRRQEAALLKRSGVAACRTCRGKGCRQCAGLGRQLRSTNRRRNPYALEDALARIASQRGGGR